MRPLKSLTNFQLRKMRYNESKEALKKVQGRIDSIVLVHKHLYLQDDPDQIELSLYFKQICDSLFKVFDDQSSRITIELEVDETWTEKRKGMNLGLIVNELVTNALKYAFPDEKQGLIQVVFKKTDTGEILEIRDNGIGMPPPEEEESSQSFGLKVVSMLARNISFDLKVLNENGTVVRLLVSLNH